jgi:hypothetical protein
MRWIRLLFRIFGWLLTPFLAWAASFFGAVAGALLAMRLEDPVEGLAITALFGALTGFAALIGWLEYLRRSPEVREVLAVTEDGTPDTTEMRSPEPADAEVPSPGPAAAGWSRWSRSWARDAVSRRRHDPRNRRALNRSRRRTPWSRRPQAAWRSGSRSPAR